MQLGFFPRRQGIKIGIPKKHEDYSNTQIKITIKTMIYWNRVRSDTLLSRDTTTSFFKKNE